MYLNRRSSYGTIYALEALEALLITTAFEQDVCVVFIDDGVYQLMNKQNTDSIGIKNFSKTFHVLGDYGINKLYVAAESLTERGLTTKDLMFLTYEDEHDNLGKKPLITIVDNNKIKNIMSEQDAVLSF